MYGPRLSTVNPIISLMYMYFWEMLSLELLTTTRTENYVFLGSVLSKACSLHAFMPIEQVYDVLL